MIDFSNCRYKSDHCPDLDRLERKAVKNAKMPQIYFITVSEKEDELLNIYPYSLLRRYYFRDTEYKAVGAAKGYKEALSLTEVIIRDILKAKGSVGRDEVCQYFS